MRINFWLIIEVLMGISAFVMAAAFVVFTLHPDLRNRLSGIPTTYRVTYDMPEEIIAAEVGDRLQVYGKDTVGSTITIHLLYVLPSEQ